MERQMLSDKMAQTVDGGGGMILLPAGHWVRR